MSVATRQLPPWLSTVLVVGGGLGVLWIIGAAQPGPPEPGNSLSSKNISAPDFSGTTLDGKTFRLSDQKGKVVLVNFWATWCGPCKMEMPDLIALQSEYASKGFTVIGLADDDLAHVADFVPKAGLNYPVMIKPEGAQEAYGATGLPTSVLVDRNGKVVYAMQGIDPTQSVQKLWEKQIEKVL